MAVAMVRCVIQGLRRKQVLTARICTSLTAQPVCLFSSESDSGEPKLCQGINYLKDGSDPPLLPDNEYPDWLWEVLQPKQPVDEEPDDLNNKTYWRRLRKIKLRQANAARKKRK
ncbi:large ribosomal subunit protein mL54-like [Pocillopora verrucosa]|uniref:large ribosomal subunit protein mL54-like n=1 Tax=Pocillopora verrucosa TaxID=203993 RepID=UPI00333F9E00